MKARRVSKIHEWNEIHISAEDFFPVSDELAKFIEEEYPSVTLVFERKQVQSDELFKIKGDKIYSSSYSYGIVGWDEDLNEYVHHYHMGTYNVGQLVRIEFSDCEELRKILNIK